MKNIILTTVFLLLSIFANAQFDVFFEQGKQQEKNGEYYPAIKSYNAAILFTDNKQSKEKAKKRINYCADRLNQLKIDALLANKKTNQILKALLPAGVTNIYAYFDSIGNYYNDLGEYAEAEKNYELARNSPDKPQNTDIETKYTNAKNCHQWQQNALNYIKTEEYDLAEKEIIKVLEINPNARKTIIIASAINPLLGLVLVQGGEFMMGSKDGYSRERPIHKVSLSTFEISKYEVTNLQYAVFLNRYGSDKILSGDYAGEEMIYKHDWGVWKNPATGKWEAQEDNEYCPVVYVTWYGSYEFCKFYGLELPSEAQWEYAAGGGQKTNSPQTNSPQINTPQTNSPQTNNSPFEGGQGDVVRQKYAGTSTDSLLINYAQYNKKNLLRTQPVGLLKPNELGIYDMSGNVWEWCFDWYDEDYYQKCEDLGSVRNPKNTEKSSYRVKRGGSWFNYANFCRVAIRSNFNPTNDYFNIGFRIIRAP